VYDVHQYLTIRRCYKGKIFLENKKARLRYFTSKSQALFVGRMVIIFVSEKIDIFNYRGQTDVLNPKTTQ